MEFTLSRRWQTTYRGAFVGILAMNGVRNPATHADLDARKTALEAELRRQYTGYDRAALQKLPRLQAYRTYYKQFNKTYHVQLQLESILKGKSIPSVAALVEAMFMAEMKNHLLTAGHDLDAVQPPVRAGVATGEERYENINGRSRRLKPNDMYIADAEGVISSVIYGPDRRTRIRAATTRVLFTVYAPLGVPETAVHAHLHEIEANVCLIAPAAETERLAVYGA